MKFKAVFILLILAIFTAFYYFKDNKKNSEIDSKFPIEESLPIINIKQQAMISFRIDDYRKETTVEGVVGNKSELEDIITNFSTAKPNHKILHDISINETLLSRDFAVNIALLLASVKDIGMLDITYSQKVITLNGLIINKQAEQETLNKLKELFSKKIEIVNNLDLVNNEDIKSEGLKFDILLKIPEIERK